MLLFSEVAPRPLSVSRWWSRRQNAHCLSWGTGIAGSRMRAHTSGANDRFAFEETAMRVATLGILISALLVGVSGSVYAQGAGGGAAGGQGGGTGMSKPNAGGSTESVSGASGSNSMAPAGATSHKKMHKKSSAATPASAPNPSSGGS
jgi:hypothetical protein